MGGYFLGPEPGSGVWWRFEFDDVRGRLRVTVRDWNDLSITCVRPVGYGCNGMDIRHAVRRAAYLRTGYHFDAGGQHVRRSMGIQVQRGERTRIRGAHAPARVSEVGSGWCFYALHVTGAEKTIADGISRWEPEDNDGNPRASRPDVAWHR